MDVEYGDVLLPFLRPLSFATDRLAYSNSFLMPALTHFSKTHDGYIEYAYPVLWQQHRARLRLGLLLGAIATTGWRLPFPAALTVLLIGCATLAVIPYWNPRALTMGLPPLALVAGLVGIEQTRKLSSQPLFKLLGDASYSIYLSHGIALSAIGQVARRAHLSATSVSVFLILGALLAGLAVYRWIEQPLIALFTPGGPFPFGQKRTA